MNDHDGVLTHLDEQGAARMVDVSAKAVTLRRARASGAVPTSRGSAPTKEILNAASAGHPVDALRPDWCDSI